VRAAATDTCHRDDGHRLSDQPLEQRDAHEPNGNNNMDDPDPSLCPIPGACWVGTQRPSEPHNALHPHVPWRAAGGRVAGRISSGKLHPCNSLRQPIHAHSLFVFPCVEGLSRGAAGWSVRDQPVPCYSVGLYDIKVDNSMVPRPGTIISFAPMNLRVYRDCSQLDTKLHLIKATTLP
jgi:hypothetical protein